MDLKNPMKEELSKIFENVTDPRSNRNQKHPLVSIIGISLLGAIAGIDSFSGLGDFTEAHLESFKNYFDLPFGAPSHDTFRTLWSMINPEEFQKSFYEFTKCLVNLKSGVISLDGKTTRNSGKNPFHAVSVWCSANELTLAQEKVGPKGGEIEAIKRLLSLLELNNRVVTIDAIGCQRAICEQIGEQGGDYLIGLKGNQKSLHDDIKQFFEKEHQRQTCLRWEEHNKGHGRIEHRIAEVTDQIEWLQHRHNWPNLKSIGMVTSRVTRGTQERQEHRYYITSLAADAETFCKTARTHWGIENKLHWRLDVVYNEDKACISDGNAVENMSIMRKWALNILQKAKSKPDQSIKSLQRKASMSFNCLLQTVNKIFHA